MNVIEKVKRSWWVVLSFIMFLNGFGFVYIGLKHNNRNWVIEGIAYEFPWFFYFIVFAMFHVSKVDINNPTGVILPFAILLMLVSVVRSIWVAIKLADVYDNEEKYQVRPTAVKQEGVQENKDSFAKFGCCLCLVAIFIVFGLIAL